MSRNMSDDEDMTSSTPSSPSTPVNTSANPHIPSLPAHLDLKTPPQSQDNTPYASRTIGATSYPAGVSGAGAPTLQTSASTASATFQDLETDLTSPGGARRRQSGPALAALSGSAGNNGVSVMPSSEVGVPAWLTKRGLEEIQNIEERVQDRQFSTQMYGSIFNDKDMTVQK
ncbi:hypothetical protein H072_9697 [Dactylellina haptotyla CBS 200.50]|uniref:Uncharacterized protein n=1 Tax=Dactylellina haptotyla (strain CBS 200.50) TaxID=1284197 RepID=S8A133_DACHA|nr:hypothetical protein H072_9697 [Dactylellina haptotyla CBS 200.50]